MKVPVSVVRQMKTRFHDHTHLARLAKAAGMPLDEEVTRKMWKGDFSGVEFKDAEVFFLMIGYEFTFKRFE